MDQKLFEKYDIPAPRYTSYPTVPYWSESPTTEQWVRELRKESVKESALWSLYIHIPYCETLCTFCGCNTVITRDHKRESPYVETVLNEWSLYQEQVPELLQRPLRQIHLGGGTPTFLSAEQLKKLLDPIYSKAKLHFEDFEGSIEVDPRRTQKDQLLVLREFGFDRVSMGVQDFDPEVQRLVNRVQPYNITKELTEEARSMGYRSVNFDLIYGLPKQSLATMEKTIALTVELKPERIALYSFALVPWIKPAQRLFKDDELPRGAEKRALYELARAQLTAAGYVEIGMDHFALPTDSLAQAAREQSLHRNFMGYTDQRTSILLGLGVSSISETPTCFHQNEKVLPSYEKLVRSKKLPTFRGHLLTDEDQLKREQILQLITTLEVQLRASEFDDAKAFLSELESDGLVEFEGKTLRLTEKGKPFLRNACMAFDQRLRSKQPEARTFSQSV